jgi:hypothetical protein
MTRELDGRWALVTGASSGIGAGLVEELAARGARLILVARRRDALEEIAARLRQRHGAEIRVETADLDRPGEPERLFQSLRAAGITVSVLANNAGFGSYGIFDSIEQGTEEAMIDLDVKAVVRMTRLFVAPMRAAGYSPDPPDGLRGRLILRRRCTPSTARQRRSC